MSIKKHVLITGATGFIGQELVTRLAQNGWEVAALTRNRDKGRKIFGDKAEVIEWDGKTSRGWSELASGAAAIINLAGENIGRGRWKKGIKARILRSRLDAGHAVTEAVSLADPRPAVVIQASAIGYYGNWGEEELDENSPPKDGWLASVVREWEESTRSVEEFGVRRVVLRSGLVLGCRGGVFPRLMKPFRLFVGGPLGRGRQWISWIHLEDEIRAILWLLERENLAGVFNLTSPSPVPNKEFSRVLGRAMKRPWWFPVPAFFLLALYGEMARETLLVSQRVIPRALLAAGFEFQFPELKSALEDLLAPRGRTKQ